MEFGEVLDDPLAEALKRATPRSTKAIIAQANAHTDAGNSLFVQFAAPRAPNASHEQLLQELDAAVDVSAVTSLLDELAALAENAARDGETTQVIDIMLGVLRREAEIQDVESRRAFTMAVRRLAKPTLLRAVALQLAHRPERRDELVSVLIRAGDTGADVLTELLEHSDDRVRRSASSALVRLGSGKAMQAIQDALKNPSSRMRMEAAAALVTRKHVRAAPTLLKALDVEKDEQVQAAFLVALGKLGTPDAVQRLLRAAEAERGVVKKTPVALRIAAVHGLTEARTPEALEALRALHDDKDPAVRAAVAVSLGRLR
jgi:HEAT repeat protein